MSKKGERNVEDGGTKYRRLGNEISKMANNITHPAKHVLCGKKSRHESQLKGVFLSEKKNWVGEGEQNVENKT